MTKHFVPHREKQAQNFYLKKGIQPHHKYDVVLRMHCLDPMVFEVLRLNKERMIQRLRMPTLSVQKPEKNIPWESHAESCDVPRQGDANVSLGVSHLVGKPGKYQRGDKKSETVRLTYLI